MDDVRPVAGAARLFTLVAIVSTAIVGEAQVGGVWPFMAIPVIATGLSLLKVSEQWITAAEAIAVAVAAMFAWPDYEVVLPYLATPTLIAGIAGGVRVTLLVWLAEVASILAAWWLIIGHQDRVLAGDVATWLTTALGLGLLGSFTRRSINRSSADASYRDALSLIRQLHALSGKLTSGLDPVDLADQAMALVSEDIVVRQAAVVIRQSSGFAPLRFSGGIQGFPIHELEAMLNRCWKTNEPVIGGSKVALPMSMNGERVAVVLADCVTVPDRKTAERVTELLQEPTVRLNAALLFTEVRESATSEERLRLAREVHDGVAQDVASLGYLVDSLAAVTTDPEQTSAVASLRREVTRVVAELRSSVFDLRNETTISQGLGQSISSFARHVGSHSDLRVHVTLDESNIRLRPRVEAELLRIAQEAINNARRHSGGENLWVSCLVQPADRRDRRRRRRRGTRRAARGFSGPADHAANAPSASARTSTSCRPPRTGAGLASRSGSIDRPDRDSIATLRAEGGSKWRPRCCSSTIMS